MYKVCSIFSQVLRLFSRGDFEKAVKEHKADGTAGFTSWGGSWPCVRQLGERIRCAKSAVWRAARGS
jgi:hypothetical protein